MAPDGSETQDSQREKNTRQLWMAFDISCGMVAPILCLLFDPAVFRGSLLGGDGYLASYRLFGYTEISLGIGGLLYTLVGNPSSPFVAGWLFAAAAFSLGLGIIMLPLSVVGLFIFIGILGFIPFLTFFAFLRRGLQVFARAREKHSAPWCVGVALAVFIITIGGPLFLQLNVNDRVRQAIDRIAEGPQAIFQEETQVLQSLSRLTSVEALVWKYSSIQDPESRSRLAKAYLLVKEEDIERAVRILED